ncbi:hypothetical protein [Nocardia sp. bgisy134]|uniref:hypothetical protein n=1 Tax=Nocardia sp. bgisy134 TaxID=3413789 RepID=UPI003D7412DE
MPGFADRVTLTTVRLFALHRDDSCAEHSLRRAVGLEFRDLGTSELFTKQFGIIADPFRDLRCHVRPSYIRIPCNRFGCLRSCTQDVDRNLVARFEFGARLIADRNPAERARPDCDVLAVELDVEVRESSWHAFLFPNVRKAAAEMRVLDETASPSTSCRAVVSHRPWNTTTAPTATT